MRNAEATRERILEAAMAEFSTYGIAGARVDRIAKTAGCNKNMIYIYFDNKETLFSTILQKHLTRVYEELPFTPDNLPGYAARVFNFAMTNPDLIRLMTWSSLEQKTESPAERGTIHDQKVAALIQAQSAGQVNKTLSPGFLLTAIMALATAWTASNPFGPSLDPDSTKNPDELKNSIAEAVRLITQGDAEKHEQ